jgi:hypothetical protein
MKFIIKDNLFYLSFQSDKYVFIKKIKLKYAYRNISKYISKIIIA